MARDVTIDKIRNIAAACRVMIRSEFLPEEFCHATPVPLPSAPVISAVSADGRAAVRCAGRRAADGAA